MPAQGGRSRQRIWSAPWLSCRGEAHLDVEPALGLGPRGERGAVRAGDRADDGQAQAVSVAVRGADATEPLERLEQALDLVRRYRGPRVAYPQGRFASDAHRG